MSKFRYYITHNEVKTELFLFGEEIFSYERNDGEVFFTMNFDSGVNAGGEGDPKHLESYKVLKGIDDSAERCQDAEFLVEIRCQNVWMKFFTGVLSMNDASFDEDKCVVQIPVNPNNLSECLTENDQEVNILNGTTPVNLSLVETNIYDWLMCPDNCITSPICNGENLIVDGWAQALSKCSAILPGTGELRLTADQTGGDIAPYSKIDGRYSCYYHDQSNQFQVYDFDLDTTTNVLGTNQDVRPFDISGDYIGLYSRQFDTVYIYEISTDTLTVVESGIGNMGNDDLAVGGDYMAYHNPSTDDMMLYKISTPATPPIVIEGTTNVASVNCDGLHVLYDQNQGADDLQLYDIAGASLVTIDSGGSYVNLNLDGNNVFYENTSGTDELHHYDIAGTSDTLIVTGGFNDVYSHEDSIVWIDGIDGFVFTAGSGTTNMTNNTGFEVTQQIVMDCGKVYVHIDNPTTTQTLHKRYDISIGSLFTFRFNLAFLEQFSAVAIMTNSIVYELGGTLFEYEFFTNTETTLLTGTNTEDFSSDCNSIAFYDDASKNVYYYRGRVPNENMITIFFREKVTLPCDGTDPVEPTGTGWILYDDDCAGSGLATWVRVPLGTVTIVESTCPGGIPVTPPGPNQYYLIGCDDGIAYYSELGEPFVYDRFRRLDDVILRVTNKVCPDITEIVSDFYQINPENVTLTNYVTGLPTDVNHLLIAQKSDFKDPLSTEPATIGNVEFLELMDYLETIHQVFWFTEEGKLRLEHISFFRKANGLDLTLSKYAKYLRAQNNYTYDANLPKEDSFVWMEAENADFVGLSIKYNQANGMKSPCVTTTVDDHDAGRITTDIDFINLKIAAGDADDIDDDGFVIVATTQTTPTDYVTIQGVGPITGLTLNNMPMSFASLHDLFWKYERPVSQGFLNGLFINFITTKRTRLQGQFFVPFCCDDIIALDPERRIVANYGQSEAERLEFDGQKDTLKLDLRTP